MSKIVEKFASDKNFVLAQTQDYLSKTPQHEDTLESLRSDAVKALTEQNDFGAALKSLEKLRDLRSGIVTTEVMGEGNTPVLIRDARNCKVPAERGSEAFEMQVLNDYRAAIEVVTMEEEIAEDPEKKKAIHALSEQLRQDAKNFIIGFHQGNSDAQKGDLSSKESQKLLSEHAKKITAQIADKLGSVGAIAPHAELEIARNFQNFNDTHYNIVTLSSLNGHVAIEAEVGLRGLTDEQTKEFNNRENAAWYKAASGFEQELIDRYADKITDGTHTIPTQLRDALPGMRNAFEKITACVEAGKSEVEILHESKHAGTLCSFVKDKDERQKITDQNARQAQEWIGQDVTLHCNTLNSEGGTKEDNEIVKRTREATKAVDGKLTNTAFNAFRHGYANDLTGAKDFLKDFSTTLSGLKTSISDENKELQTALETVQKSLEPAGFFSRMSRQVFGDKSKEALEKLQGAGLLNSKDAELVQDASKLARSVENAEKSSPLASAAKAVGSFLFKAKSENKSLDVSTQIGLLAGKIKASAIDNTQPNAAVLAPEISENRQRTDEAFKTVAEGKLVGLDVKEKVDQPIGVDDVEIEMESDGRYSEPTVNVASLKFSQEETLTMCASGKDRTGLAMHDQSAQVLAKRFGMNINDVDKALLAAGHTAQQAGSVFAGGATIGCHGTKKENLAGIPNDRPELDAIVEISSGNNKVSGAKDEKDVLQKGCHEKEEKFATLTEENLKKFADVAVEVGKAAKGSDTASVTSYSTRENEGVSR